MRNPLDLLNKFIGAVIGYGPKNKTKKARMARKAARRKKLAAMKRDWPFSDVDYAATK